MNPIRYPGLFLLTILLALPVRAAETLHVLAWPGYVSKEAIRTFEAKYNAKVELTIIGNDDELWEHSNAENRSYDLIAVNTAELRRYIDADLVISLFPKNIPNTKRQTSRFRNLQSIPGIMYKGAPYAIPYTYSAMGLIYNRQLVQKPPSSMTAMWDPRYAGQVLAYNGSAHNFSLTALFLGYSNPFNLNNDQFGEVINRLRKLRHNVLKFYDTPEEVVELFKSRQVALIFANYGDQQIQALQKAGADIGYVIPKEGALAWMDCWAILKKTRNIKLSEAWINHMLTPAVSGQLTREQGLANTLRDTPKPSMPDTGKLIWLRPVEDNKKRTEYWNRLMAGTPDKR